MADDVKPIPDEYPQLTPYLCVDGAKEAMEFYGKVFGAEERMQLPAPGDKIGHAEMKIGNALIMLADEHPEMEARGPRSIGGTPVVMSLYVEDVEAVWKTALEAGATEVQPLEDKFYGDRSGQFEDPFGHRWSIATHVEDVSPDEMEKRMNEMAPSD